VSERRPRIAVVTFPGSNDDGDARLALEQLGADAVAVWYAATELDSDIGGIVLPGGFSYGDYLRCGALARSAPVMNAVREFAADGGPVLGICNGFQILCEAGLLPGVLRPNRQLEFLCADVTVVVESTGAPITTGLAPGDELVIPVKHGEGGIANRDGNVVGLMPHPEHAVDPLLGPTGGLPLLQGLIVAARERLAGYALDPR